VIRIIRLLGAAIGALVGLTFVLTKESPFEHSASPTLIILLWVIAWVLVGFLLLPYLTVVPVGRLIREVQAMSTAEFVACVVGLLLGLLMGLLLGLPLMALPDPFGRYLPLGVSICLGLGMVGLTVAKREDLVAAAQAAGLMRRSDRRYQCHHRWADCGHRRFRIPIWAPGHPSFRSRRVAADRR
jgi:uncharacterized protein YacL